MISGVREHICSRLKLLLNEADISLEFWREKELHNFDVFRGVHTNRQIPNIVCREIRLPGDIIHCCNRALVEFFLAVKKKCGTTSIHNKIKSIE